MVFWYSFCFSGQAENVQQRRRFLSRFLECERQSRILSSSSCCQGCNTWYCRLWSWSLDGNLIRNLSSDSKLYVLSVCGFGLQDVYGYVVLHLVESLCIFVCEVVGCFCNFLTNSIPCISFARKLFLVYFLVMKEANMYYYIYICMLCSVNY